MLVEVGAIHIAKRQVDSIKGVLWLSMVVEPESNLSLKLSSLVVEPESVTAVVERTRAYLGTVSTLLRVLLYGVYVY